jgi:hypothetical protein
MISNLNKNKQISISKIENFCFDIIPSEYAHYKKMAIEGGKCKQNRIIVLYNHQNCQIHIGIYNLAVTT